MSKIVTLIFAATALAAAGLSTGCYAEVTPDAAYVDAPPPEVDVATYPQYVYEGQTVYLVNDRWYTRHGNGWAYYRTEPEELHRRRVQQVHAAPARHEERPRVREQEHRGEAPRARRVD